MGEHPVGDTCVPRPRSGLRHPSAEAEICRAFEHGLGDQAQLTRIQRPVAVHETDEIGLRGEQPGVAGGAEAASWFVHHPRARQSRHFRRSVPGAVVDDQRLEAGRHRAEDAGNRLRLVQRWEDDVDHAGDATGTNLTRSETNDPKRWPGGRSRVTCADMILVTGGGGFIGSHIVDDLVAAGHEVRVLDSLLPAAHAGRPDYLNPDAEFVEADVRDAGVLRTALRGVDAVCHQASMVGLGVNMLDVEDYVGHNDLGTAVLLGQLAATRFCGRLVLASSMVVYGEGAYRCAEHGRVAASPRDPVNLAAGRFTPTCPWCDGGLTPVAVDESSPLDPRNVYAATKVHQEHLCFAFSRETGVPVTALRYHNVYGPRMPRDTPYAGVAAIFASALAAGAAPRVFEDGEQLRDFVHVRDVARANVIALTCADPRVGAFNVASGAPRSVGEMAETLADAAGDDAPRPLVTGQFRLGDVRHVFASAELAERVLGFKASEDFREGMAEFARSPFRTA